VKRYWHFFICIVFFILAIPALYWFESEEHFANGLNFPWLDSNGLLELAKYQLYCWDSRAYLGYMNVDINSSAFFFAAWLVSLFTQSIEQTQHLFFYLCYVFCSISMYLLGIAIRIGRFGSFIGAAFYLIIPWVATGAPLGRIGIRNLCGVYIFLPLTTALAIKFFRSGCTKDLAIFGVISFFSALAYSSLQYFAFQIFSFIIIAICALIIAMRNAQPSKIKPIALYLLKIFVVFLFSNATWLLHFIASISYNYSMRSERIYSDADLFAGMGGEILYSLYFIPGKGIYLWQQFYLTGPAVFIITFLIAVSFSSILWSRHKERVLLLLVLIALFLFLNKGANAPFGLINKILFTWHPYITRLFRNPTYFEIPLIISMVLLIANTAQDLFTWRFVGADRIKIVFLVIVLLSIGMYGYPFWNGNYVKEVDVSKQLKHIIPDDYLRLTEFLKKDKKPSRILYIPTFLSQSNYVMLKFGENTYLGGPFLHVWTGKSFMIKPYDNENQKRIINLLEKAPDQKVRQELIRLAGIYGLKYIILDHNVDWANLEKFENGTRKLDFNKISENLMYYGMSTNTFGALEIFALNDDETVPICYSTNQAKVLLR
jgi:hypothetical protein